jgi:hypothetical protein
MLHDPFCLGGTSFGSEPRRRPLGPRSVLRRAVRRVRTSMAELCERRRGAGVGSEPTTESDDWRVERCVRGAECRVADVRFARAPVTRPQITDAARRAAPRAPTPDGVVPYELRQKNVVGKSIRSPDAAAPRAPAPTPDGKNILSEKIYSSARPHARRGPPRPRAPTHDRTASSGDGASASYDVRYERSYDKKMRKDKHMPLNTRQPRHSRQTIVCGVLARSAPPRLDTSKLQRRRYAT